MQSRREAASGFLHSLTDPDYRLPGEESSADASLEDSRRWAMTYGKLINFKHELLELCHRYVEESEPDVARAIRETDVILLEVQVSRFEQRRDFWRIRATELAGYGPRGERN